MDPNVVWVTLDSVRADHTTMGGYHRDTTPNLARIADGEDGAAFQHCISSGTGTPYSSASILSGTYPTRHGVKIDNEYLPERLETLPETLGRAGYRTACLSRNSYVSPGTGLDRGFDRFSWVSGSTILDAVPLRTLVKYFFNLRRHSAGLARDTAKYATPYVMNDTAKRWLDDLRAAEPFFFYLHYNEPHRPYYPPLPWMDTYTDDIEMSASEAAEFAIEVHRTLDERIAEGLDFTDEEWAALHAMYDAEIRYTDEMIGRLFDHVQSLDLGPTIFVVTADHGELFGERGLLSHKVAVDDALTHVPLVTHGFGDIEGQADELVQHVDLTTTLSAMVGEGIDQHQGVDLRETTREHAFVQRGPFDFDLFTDVNPDFDTSRFHHGPVHGIRTKEFRYERSDSMERLYELPDEETDVRQQYPEVTEDLSATLEAWVEANADPIEAESDSQLDESMRRQLRDLGYVE
ncbi:sulfatase [Natronomonas marina]|jgi:arylsulfatase A-like enzyme|uniref:sulfatase n=1 Tax=Natronomonas marina TaxID=2961939 RepID=UPI0020CA143E|nr:sulfatase [Natronomonas marina]